MKIYMKIKKNIKYRDFELDKGCVISIVDRNALEIKNEHDGYISKVPIMCTSLSKTNVEVFNEIKKLNN